MSALPGKRWFGRTGVVRAVGQWKISLEETLRFLGDAHFVEEDPSRTHSGTERVWVYELSNSLALAFRYHDETQELFVGSNRVLDEIDAVAHQFIPIEFDEVSGVMWE